MRVVLKDGFALDVDDFKAVRGGAVLLRKDKDKENVGFVPFEQLQYILPEEIARQRGHVKGVPGVQQQPGQQAGQPAMQQPQSQAQTTQQRQQPTSQQLPTGAQYQQSGATSSYGQQPRQQTQQPVTTSSGQ
jgi:hypothetical protein